MTAELDRWMNRGLDRGCAWAALALALAMLICGIAAQAAPVGLAQVEPTPHMESLERAQPAYAPEGTLIHGGVVVHSVPMAALPVAAKLRVHAPEELSSKGPDLGPEYARETETETETAAALPAVGAAPPLESLGRFRGRYGVDVGSFDFERLPGRLSAPSLRGLWREGLRLERDDYLLDSAARYELIVGQVPEESFTYWRIARNYWRHGESLPTESAEERVRYFELAEDWSARGLSIDPECAACMLWKFVSMGRQATTRGLLTAISDTREMDELLKRGIALQPTHSDDDANSTLGNLYYAGAVFYRIVPEWFWVRWVLGMRGDKALSLEYARKAVAMADMRVDYRVELGASLLCYGASRKKPLAIVEGFEVLRQAEDLDLYLSTDHLDQSHARVLIEAPQKACGYSRDGFIDVDQVVEGAGLGRR